MGKFLGRILIPVVLFSASFQAFGALTEPDVATLGTFKNYAVNGGAEQNKAGWAVSGTSAALTNLVVDTTNKYEGNAGFTWTPANADNFLTNAALSITANQGLSARDCAALVFTKTTETTHAIEAYDGTSVLNTVTIPSSTVFIPVAINWPCSSSGSNRIRFNAGSTTAISFDSAKWGDARGINLGTVQQATFYGSLKIPGTTNCNWTVTTSVAATFSADTDCPSYTVTGSVTAPATKIPALVVQGPGRFVIYPGGATWRTTSAGDGSISYYLSDGTLVSSSYTATILTANDHTSTTPVTGAFTIEITDSATHQLAIYVDTSDGAATTTLANSYPALEGSGLAFNVYRFPLTTEQTYRPEVYNWRVDANISGANPSLGTSDITSYTGIENGSLTLTNNSGALTAQIPCSSTNPPTGTTCSAGNESLGVSFTVPAAGAARACVSFGQSINNGASGKVSTTFQIVETPSNAQTITNEGRSRVPGANETTLTVINLPYQVCGTFDFSSAGQKTLRLMYEQDVTATVNSNIIIADASANDGQRDVHWEVYPITQTIGPVIISGPRSEVRMDTYAAASPFGSTNTAVFRFSNTFMNTGTAFTTASDAALGHSITLREAGVYCANGAYLDGGVNATVGIYKNATSLGAGSGAELSSVQNGQAGANRNKNAPSACFVGAIGDVLRMLGSGTTDQPSASGSANGYFRIVKVAN